MRYRLSLVAALGLVTLGASQRALAADSTAAWLAQRVEALDQKVRVLERLRELEQEGAAAKAKDAPAVSADSRDGFTIRSPDNSCKLKIGGYTQADGRLWFADPQKARVNTFLLRRVRPQFDGTLSKYVDFRIMPDFGGGTTALQDAYLSLNLRPGLKVQAGKYKPPVGLERLQSGASLLFAERGLPTHLLPNRDLGIQVHGDLANAAVSYAVGLFNGVVDGGSGDTDTNDGKDLAVRVFAQPFRNDPDSPLKGLGLGVAGTSGSQEGPLPAYRTPGQVSFYSYTDTTVADGRRLRISPQAYVYAGRLGLLGEYAISRQEVARKTTTAQLRNTAWQVAASYVVTGESPSYRGVTPRKPFDLDEGEWGAFEVAGRVHRLAIDRDAFPVFANPSRSARSADAWAVGLNWHLNRSAKLNLDYEQTRFAGGAANGGDRKPEKVFFQRLQVAF